MLSGLGAAIGLGLTAALGYGLVALLRFGMHSASGAFKPLTRKDDDRDNPLRGLVSGTTFTALPPSAFDAEIIAQGCPLHGKPYVGYTQFWLSARAHGDDTLNVVACEACVRAALKAAGLEWKRSNQKQHPVEFSAQIYPLLLGDNTAVFRSALIAFETDLGFEAAESLIRSRSVDERCVGALSLAPYATNPRARSLLELLKDDKERARPGLGEGTNARIVADLLRHGAVN